jgi:hypothetical protein
VLSSPLLLVSCLLACWAYPPIDAGAARSWARVEWERTAEYSSRRAGGGGVRAGLRRARAIDRGKEERRTWWVRDLGFGLSSTVSTWPMNLT